MFLTTEMYVYILRRINNKHSFYGGIFLSGVNEIFEKIYRKNYNPINIFPISVDSKDALHVNSPFEFFKKLASMICMAGR